jgi:hypothetical protein
VPTWSPPGAAVGVPGHVPRTAVNSQWLPPSAPCEREANSGFEPVSNAWNGLGLAEPKRAGASYGPSSSGCASARLCAIACGSVESSLAKITTDSCFSGTQALKELKPELCPE